MKSFKQFILEATAATSVDVFDKNDKLIDTIGWNRKPYNYSDTHFLKKFVKSLYKDAVKMVVKVRNKEETVEKL